MSDPDEVLRRSLVRPEREQHGGLVVERVADAVGAYRVRAMPTVERLFRRGLLSERQCYAGLRIYEAWAIGIVGARDADEGGSSVFDPAGVRDRQVIAAAEYRRIRDAVGGRMWPLAFSVSVEDWSVDRFSNERGGGMDRRQLMGVLKIALDIAADALGLPP